MPKFIPGNYQEWSGLIETCLKNGYSSVHFTPLQKIGLSGSPYCIADQLQFERGGRKDLGKILFFVQIRLKSGRGGRL